MFTKLRANALAPVREPSGAGGARPRLSLGELVRARREALGLTLGALARRAGCAKSYLWRIESGAGGEGPGAHPSEAFLRRLAAALELGAEEVVEAAQWAATPAPVQAEVARLHGRDRAAQRLAAILAGGWSGRGGGALDEAYRSGELRRLVDALCPGAEPGGAASDARAGEAPVPVRLRRRVPLINKVAAGYPAAFTDLGYPARVADEYVATAELEDPDAFAARVVGDSMAPAYLEGDIVVFSPARPVADGADCFVRLEPDHEATFKRVYFETDGDGRALIRLQPLNAAYAARVVERERIAGLYAAVSVTRAVGP